MLFIIRKPYEEKPRVQISFDEPGQTKQAFKDECDINNIMKKFQKTGAITHANNRFAEYGFATSVDFTESMAIVIQAQELFNELPSSIRAKFGNSPEAFLDFAQNPDNSLEMAKMGLSEPEDIPTTKTEENIVVETVDPSSTIKTSSSE